MGWSKREIKKLPPWVQDHIASALADMEQNTGNVSERKNTVAAYDSPCCLHIHSIRKRLADPDGISAKAAIDGLVLVGLFRSDSAKEIQEVTYSQEIGSPEQTVITLCDYEQGKKT